MACNQTLSGIARDCSTSMGGILQVLLANKEDVTAVATTESKITTITMASSKKFKAYHFNKETGSMTSTFTIDHTTGARYVTTELALIFNRMDTAKRIEITALSQNDLVALVEDGNHNWWYMGFDEAIVAASGDAQTGTARGDRNGYSITLQDTSLDMPYEVDSTIISGLL